MKKARIKWKNGAFREIRTDPNVAADLDARAERVRSTAAQGGGEFYSFSETSGGRGRHRAGVVTGNVKAMRRSQKDNALLRALDSGR